MIRQSHQRQQRQGEEKSLRKYKLRLILQIFFFFTFCSLFLLERVFYDLIIKYQTNFIKDFQLNNGLSKVSEEGTIPSGIFYSFYTFWARLSNFNMLFLLLTHAFATLYVGFDSFITSKVIVMALIAIQVVTFFQTVYHGSNPFWFEGVFASSCKQSYSHPDISSILLILLPSYIYLCWVKQNPQRQKPRGSIFLLLGIVVLNILFMFLNYVTGQVFISSMCFGMLFVIAFMSVFNSFNSRLDFSLRMLTSQENYKSYQIKWIFGIMVLTLFVLTVYSGTDRFEQMPYISNFLQCRRYAGEDQSTTSYDEVIGSWFTFKQSASVFALIGFIFAFPYCQLQMKSKKWCKGNFKQRLINILAVNIFILPSWIFEYLIKSEQLVKNVHLNSYLIDSIHYFILYFCIFGLLPVYIFQSLLKTVQILDYSSGYQQLKQK